MKWNEMKGFWKGLFMSNIDLIMDKWIIGISEWCE